MNKADLEIAFDKILTAFGSEEMNANDSRKIAAAYKLTESEQRNVNDGFSPQNYTDYLTDQDICSDCGESKVAVMYSPFGDNVRRGRRKCFCDREADRLWEEKQRREERERKLRELKKYSLMEDEFFNCSFDNWVIANGQEGEKLYNLARNYVNRWEEMKEENIGLLLFGGVGAGKSYAAFAIANALIEKEVSVMAISLSGILQKIKSTFGNSKQSEIDVINSLKAADLLIIDDLGTESNTEWAKEKIYEIIDSRYRMRKPIIITTNLSLEQLSQKLTADDGVERIYDRITEMCQRFETKGRSRRTAANRTKRSLIDELTQTYNE